MIRLNVQIITETEENRRLFVAKATELVELSLHDKGCIGYDLFQSRTNNDRFLILETWRSEADLQAHMATEHFRRLVPEMEKYATLSIEKFNF